MKLPSLFKQQKNRTYQYTPRYYDERKERLEELKRKRENNSDSDYKLGGRRKSYREQWKLAREHEKKTNTRIRFWIIFIFLVLVAWMAIRYINIEKLF